MIVLVCIDRSFKAWHVRLDCILKDIVVQVARAS